MYFLVAFLSAFAIASALPHYLHHERIFNGNDAEAGQFPFMVSINDAMGYQWCDGVIINTQWILTTVPCATLSTFNDSILVGTHLNDLETGQIFHMSQVFIHEEFDDVTAKNDIALIQLDGELVFDNFIQPIEIGEVSDNVNCTTMGWGSTQNDSYPMVLQYVEETTIDLENCIEKIDEGIYYLGDETICAENNFGGSVCVGDIGGPLVCDGKVAGLVTYSYLSCDSQPDVFTRVSSYKDWIDSKISTY